MEAFGKEWKQWAMADDGACWHDTRWSFVGAALQGSTLRLSSLPEAVWEPRLTKDRLADDEPSSKRRRSRQKQPNDNKVRETETRTIPGTGSRRSLEGHLWTMAPARSRTQKGGSAAIVDSANVAGWLNCRQHTVPCTRSTKHTHKFLSCARGSRHFS